MCILDLYPFGEPSQGTEQHIHLPFGLQAIKPAQGGDDALASFLPFPAVLHQLEVLILPGPFNSDEHDRPPADLTIFILAEISLYVKCNSNVLGTAF
ncbi:MAG: hypothetical protein ACE5LQ_03815 [Candidatus Bipolaricaulia bacterium]